ncbi:rRNA maturation RNase YbeY [Telluribacter sp. SYSU D00476]|uniref:rRNA maturation RNase YbeY n=1 Tax=Telluribacter sp. SYSU D00476 TaxID=2811430 RepID=UPI001FF2E395|nr:rRNA maturation RNase YbeY [Telluribacter sp. SYSU D00476]
MINFFQEDVSIKVPTPLKTKRWLKAVVEAEGAQLNHLNYIFCSDEYLLNVNREYLEHDYYTDIITFDTSDEGEDQIEGDIFVSIDRVKENAQNLTKSFEDEFRRVLVHGVLHLIGYDDTTDESEAEMRKKEDDYLQIFKEL